MAKQHSRSCITRGQNYFVSLPFRWPCNHQNFAVGRKWNQRDIESNDLTGTRKAIRALDTRRDRDPIPPIIDPDRSLKRYSPNSESFPTTKSKKFKSATLTTRHSYIYIHIEIQRFVQRVRVSNFQYRKIREILIPPRAEDASIRIGEECTLVYSNRRTRNTYNFPREHKRRWG